MRTIPGGNTNLTFGYVTIPIQVCKCTKDIEVKLARGTMDGHEVGRVEIDKVTQEQLTADKIIRGVRSGDQFYPISKVELDNIDEITHLENIEVMEFVDFDLIPFQRVTGSYYLQVPAKMGNPIPMKIFVEGLLDTGKAAVAKWVASTRQKLVVIWPREDGALVMNTLCFANSWQEPDDQVLEHMEAEVEGKYVDKLVEFINEESGGGNSLELAVDERVVLYQELVDKTLTGEPIEVEGAKVPIPTVNEDLMGTLEAMVEDKKPKSKKGRKTKAPAKASK